MADEEAKRTALLDAAAGVFLRFGFRKASMDEIARAAGLSRQGLYFHYSTKEALLRAVVAHLMTATREAGRSALSRESGDLEARLFDAFDAMYGGGLGEAGTKHMQELFATASELLGDQFDSGLGEAIVAEITRALKTDGVAARWQALGIPAKAVAENLYETSYGLKHRGLSRDDYRARMRVAVRIVCRGGR